VKDKRRSRQRGCCVKLSLVQYVPSEPPNGGLVVALACVQTRELSVPAPVPAFIDDVIHIALIVAVVVANDRSRLANLLLHIAYFVFALGKSIPFDFTTSGFTNKDAVFFDLELAVITVLVHVFCLFVRHRRVRSFSFENFCHDARANQ